LERSLSVLLPVHNVQSTLGATVERFLEILPELTRRFEVVIADDGSTDATIEVADELATWYPQVIAVHHAARRGRSEAIRTALERSTGDVLLLGDAESNVRPGDLRRLWAAMDGHDIVLRRAPCPPSSRRPGGREAHAAARGGVQLLSRRAIVSFLDSLADQTTLLAALAERGCAWHEVETADLPQGRHAPRQSARSRSVRPSPVHAGPARPDPAPSAQSGPKRPNYLSRLRDFALGE
jgi:glycosyltransferase involved in cell wall biosynthesis